MVSIATSDASADSDGAVYLRRPGADEVPAGDLGAAAVEQHDRAVAAVDRAVDDASGASCVELVVDGHAPACRTMLACLV